MMVKIKSQLKEKWKLKHGPEFFEIEENCLDAVKQNGLFLKYIKNQTEEICLEAIRNDGRAIQYVKNKTFEICIESIKMSKYCIWLMHSIDRELFKKVELVHRLLYE